jgi:hypothetical protein
MKLLTNDLLIKMDEKGEDYRKDFVVLDKHPDFMDQWYVHAFDESFFYDVGEKIGRYKAVSTAQINDFVDLCEEMGKEVIWTEDPSEDIRRYMALNDVPDVAIESPFDNTVNGFLPFQVQGFNFLKNLKGECDILEAKVKFIQLVIAEKIIVFNKKKDFIVEQIKKHDLLKINGGYDYLLDLKLSSFTVEKIEELTQKMKKMQGEHSLLESTTIPQLWTSELKSLEF